MRSSDLLNLARSQPEELRQLLKDPQVVSILEELGLQLTIYELHAPSENSRTSHGLGPTICNDRARRHPTLVTCKRCLKKQVACGRTAENFGAVIRVLRTSKSFHAGLSSETKRAPYRHDTMEGSGP
jgi:hypothetical protein